MARPGVLRQLALAQLFRPDIVKIGLDSETASHLRELACHDAAARHPDAGVGEPRTAGKDGLVPVAIGNGAA